MRTEKTCFGGREKASCYPYFTVFIKYTVNFRSTQNMTPCQIFLLALTATASTLVQARTPLELDQGLVSRNSSGDWRRVGRTPDNEQLPLIVHLRHTPEQLQELENEFWQVSTPDDKKYGMHLTQGMCLMMWNHYLLFLTACTVSPSFFLSLSSSLLLVTPFYLFSFYISISSFTQTK